MRSRDWSSDVCSSDLWHFAADGVAFSNRLESARLNDVQRLGSDHYVVTIAPEIVPINPSPWYGFTVSAETERPLRIELSYRDGKARYWPKLRRDGVHWHQATSSEAHTYAIQSLLLN